MRRALRVWGVSLAAGAAVFFAVPVSAGDKPQETTVREEARAVIVEVPVNVIDKYGRPIENLKAEDFEVFDDGKKQVITGFDVIDLRKPLPLAEDGTELPLNPAARRHFLILFDLTFGSPKAIVNSRRAARDFVVNRMRDSDLAAVATFSVEQGLRLLVSFTGDRGQLAAAVDSLGFYGLADRTPDPLGLIMVPPSQTSATGFNFITGAASASTTGADAAFADLLDNLEVNRARSFRAIYRDRVDRLLRSLQALAISLDSFPGRKHVLYLSEGFDSRELEGSTRDGGGSKEANWVIQGQSWKVDSDTRWGNSQLQASMEKALSFFNRSDCTVHAIDIGGLRAGSDVTLTDQTVDGQSSLYFMAEETGGQFLHNSNDLSGAFDKLVDRTGLMYVLAFQPVRVPENGKFHQLKVKVRDKSWHVSARSGYTEPKSPKALTPAERKLAMSEAVAAAVPKTDVPAWVLSAPLAAGKDRSRVAVVVEVPGDRLLKGHTAPQMNVELFVYAIDGKGQTLDYLHQPVAIDLKVAEARLAKAGLKFYGEMSLPPGQHTLRTLVRDNETGRFGVTVNPVKVPPAGSPSAAPPLFVEAEKPWIMLKDNAPEKAERTQGEYPFAIGGESFIPAALAGTSNGEKSRVCVIAYNFPVENGALDVSARAVASDGKPRGNLDVHLVRASDGEREGARKVMLEIVPRGLDPGRYALAVRIRDPRTGSAAESSAPFDVR